MSAQAELTLPPTQANEVIQDKLERVLRALNDVDIEPAAHARLTLEAERLRNLLRQPEAQP